MINLPENIDLQWIGRTLLAIQRDTRDMHNDLDGVREDQRAMRTQVDVIVMTSLRLERGMASLGDDVRTLRDRINRLERRQMIRIEITAAAYAAIAAGSNPDSLLEALRSPLGGFYLWLDKVTVNRLNASRCPGESYSEAILRLASEGA